MSKLMTIDKFRIAQNWNVLKIMFEKESVLTRESIGMSNSPTTFLYDILCILSSHFCSFILVECIEFVDTLPTRGVEQQTLSIKQVHRWFGWRLKNMRCWTIIVISIVRKFRCALTLELTCIFWKDYKNRNHVTIIFYFRVRCSMTATA